MSYLELVTECEHGETRFHRSPVGVEPEWECPGGSRERVEPDYQHGQQTANFHLAETLYFPDLARHIIDAALGLDE